MRIEQYRYLVIEPTLLHLAKYDSKMATRNAIDLMQGTSFTRRS